MEPKNVSYEAAAAKYSQQCWSEKNSNRCFNWLRNLEIAIMLACIATIPLEYPLPVGSYDTISSFYKPERGSCESAVITMTKGSVSYLYASTMQFISVVSRYARMLICAFDEDCQRTRYSRRKMEERHSVYVTNNIL